MNIVKKYEILKAIDILNEASDIVYQHDYYGLPSTLTEEQQKPLDGEGGCIFNTDPYYEELFETLFKLTCHLKKQLIKQDESTGE